MEDLGKPAAAAAEADLVEDADEDGGEGEGGGELESDRENPRPLENTDSRLFIPNFGMENEDCFFAEPILVGDLLAGSGGRGVLKGRSLRGADGVAGRLGGGVLVGVRVSSF